MRLFGLVNKTAQGNLISIEFERRMQSAFEYKSKTDG